MKSFVVACLFVFALSAADVPEGVPKGATRTGEHTYRFVDRDGKAWVYRRTPFGFAKSSEADAAKAPEGGERSRMNPFGEDKSAAAGPASATATPFGDRKTAAPAPDTKVFDEGDTVRFERMTPFGVTKWTRKKAELTADEQALYQRRDNGANKNAK